MQSIRTIADISLLLLVSIFHCISAKSQQQLNLDFETSSIEGAARPWGWSIDQFAQATTIQLDSTIRKQRNYSLLMSGGAENSKKDIQVLGFGIDPFQLRSKTITLEGWIKSENLEGTAHFSILYSENTEELTDPESEKTSQKLSGTNDWTQVTTELQVPPNASLVYLRLHHSGVGKAWFDGFKLLVDGKALEQVQIAPALSKKQKKWLKKNTISISGVNASQPGQHPNYKDFYQFGQLVKDAQIIALGESTHGTSEFFRLKHRILEYAVRELGIRIFAIEDNQLTVERVNSYVLNGVSKDRSMMQGMFSVWQNEEVFNMIKWVRAYNLEHPDDKVSFVGFDMQSHYLPLDSLFTFLERQEPTLADSVEIWLEDLKQNGHNQFMVSIETKLAWFEQAQKSYEALLAKKMEWLKAAKTITDSFQIKWGIQYANLVKQFAENAFKGHLSFYRDEAMAENISWILSMHPPGTKMLVWAHDNHIARGDHPDNDLNFYFGLSMGRHLSKKYGDKYKAFGLSTYEGDYWAQISYFDFRQQPCPLYPGPIGSLDEALHQIALKKKSPALLLDLQEGRTQHWLSAPLPVRFANHVNIEYGYWTRYSIPYQFDGIFFVDKTSAAKSYARK